MSETDFSNPQSRAEKILAKTIQKYTGSVEDPQSRIEELLLALNDYIVQLANTDGSGATPDWNETDETADGFIMNKPAIKSGATYKAVLESGAMEATEPYAHAEGLSTSATGTGSHAEGNKTTASSFYSHAEGTYTTASGTYSHAEGQGTIASGYAAHAEDYAKEASGGYSHAEGMTTISSGYASHAEGLLTIAKTAYQHVFGACNAEDPSESGSQRGTYVEIVGNGTEEDIFHAKTRSNARTLDWEGNEVLAGKLTVGKDPVDAMDVTTKRYVDVLIANLQGQIDALSSS